MLAYPKVYQRLYRHWIRRFAVFLLGIVLLYAPFALLTRLLLFLTNTPLQADAHRVCLRMPIQWLAQPWMYQTMIEQPTYLGAVLVLPALSLFVGPLFCGWMCPAGQLTEFLSRLVPSRLQINPAGKLDATPIRYGFTIGMMAAAFVGANVCCSFCNFAHTQSLIGAVFGDTLGISYWASFTVVSFLLWFVVLGLFTRGGRGWCNLLCPAGAFMGLSHVIGGRLRIGRSMTIDRDLCRTCGTCMSSCPSWAISAQGDTMQINPHACSVCMDCTQVCDHSAISYSGEG